jgi:hypothetical protein
LRSAQLELAEAEKALAGGKQEVNGGGASFLAGFLVR